MESAKSLWAIDDVHKWVKSTADHWNLADERASELLGTDGCQSPDEKTVADFVDHLLSSVRAYWKLNHLVQSGEHYATMWSDETYAPATEADLVNINNTAVGNRAGLLTPQWFNVMFKSLAGHRKEPVEGVIVLDDKIFSLTPVPSSKPTRLLELLDLMNKENLPEQTTDPLRYAKRCWQSENDSLDGIFAVHSKSRPLRTLLDLLESVDRAQDTGFREDDTTTSGAMTTLMSKAKGMVNWILPSEDAKR